MSNRRSQPCRWFCYARCPGYRQDNSAPSHPRFQAPHQRFPCRASAIGRQAGKDDHVDRIEVGIGGSFRCLEYHFEIGRANRWIDGFNGLLPIDTKVHGLVARGNRTYHQGVQPRAHPCYSVERVVAVQPIACCCYPGYHATPRCRVGLQADLSHTFLTGSDVTQRCCFRLIWTGGCIGISQSHHNICSAFNSTIFYPHMPQLTRPSEDKASGRCGAQHLEVGSCRFAYPTHA